MNAVLEQMKLLKMSQVTMLLELRQRDINVSPPELSNILRGILTSPKAKIVLEECGKIVTEHKAQGGSGS